MYYVHEDFPTQEVRVHRADCSFCNGGRGIHVDASDDNRRWYGPFMNLAEAETSARATLRPWSHCGHCGPASGADFKSALPRTLGRRPTVVDSRVADLIRSFERYLDAFSADLPFSGVQTLLHEETVALSRRASSVEELVRDRRFARFLHATLEAWGMNSRAARLIPLTVLQERLNEHCAEIEALRRLRLGEVAAGDLSEIGDSVWRLIDHLRPSERDSTIVAGSKLVHHLLPDLLPPIDRRYTLRFFGRPTLQAKDEAAFFQRVFRYFAQIAGAPLPSFDSDVGGVMQTGIPKVIDNAIIGYVTLEMQPQP